MKFCVTAHIGPGQIFSLLGAVPPRIPKFEIFGHLIANNISKTVSRSVTRRLQFNINSTRAFRKCSLSHGTVAPPPGECTPCMVSLCIADAHVFNVSRCVRLAVCRSGHRSGHRLRSFFTEYKMYTTSY